MFTPEEKAECADIVIFLIKNAEEPEAKNVICASSKVQRCVETWISTKCRSVLLTFRYFRYKLE